MSNCDTEAAHRYHERTKHSFASVRASGHVLDWANRPSPFKDYLGLEPLPLLEGPLGSVLRLGAGVTRTRTYPGGLTYHFRAYASAGALYPVEVYAASAEPPGLYHFHPGEHALRRLRGVDVRAALAAAADEPALAEAGAVLVLTGILWRSSWKYQARAYRHLYWDAGTMLANLLALAAADGLEPRLLTGFVDAEVNSLLGLDGEREAALALLALGQARRATAPPPAEPLELEVAPLSRSEVSYPEADELHRASSLETADQVRRYRAGAPPAEGPAPPELSREALEHALRRRGSCRDFSPEPVPQAELAAILAYAAGPIPADSGAWTETAVIANAVEGLAPGVYRFSPPDRFELVRAGDFRRQAGYLALGQPLAARAAATLFFLADLDRVLAALGNRGYRAAQLEGGIRTGRIYLGAYAQGLAATGSTFYDDDVTDFLAPGTAKAPMLCAALGLPARR